MILCIRLITFLCVSDLKGKILFPERNCKNSSFNQLNNTQKAACMCVCSVMTDSVIPWTVAAKLLCLWEFSSKKTGVGGHFLLQGIFPAQGSKLRLLQCRRIPSSWATGEVPKAAWKWKSLRHDQLFPWTIQSVGVSRPGYWVGSLSLLQGIFPSQGSNPGLLHCR